MKPTKIVLHHSLTNDGQTVSWGAIRKFHIVDLNWIDIGYHFGVEQVGNDYEIFVGRMMNKIGAHCKGKNDSSLGVCFVGNFDLEPPPQLQFELGLGLVKTLCDVFQIDKHHVYPHHRFAPWKTCPGTQFGVDRFLKHL